MWEGLDTEIGREIAKAIFGTQGDPDSFIEWVPVTSATRIPSLTDNKADVIIKTFTINEDRKKQIDFFRSSLMRSEEHTSELQSRPHLVCRLLLEKKKNFSSVVLDSSTETQPSVP